MSRKQTPSEFLKLIIGRPVVVKLNSGVDYRGVLVCLDGYMNIALEQTEEYVNGQLKNKYGDAFIRGNNVNLEMSSPNNEKSSIYQERDFLLSANSCSLILLSEAVSLGESVINRLIESRTQMSAFSEMMETILSSVSKLYSFELLSQQIIDQVQLDQYKIHILSVLTILCNFLAHENGRKWFVEEKKTCIIVKQLLELRKLIEVKSNEEMLLKLIFTNLKPYWYELSISDVEMEELNHFIFKRPFYEYPPNIYDNLFMEFVRKFMNVQNIHERMLNEVFIQL